MSRAKRIAFFGILVIVGLGWIKGLLNIPWLEFTTQPAHRISILTQGTLLIVLIIWLSIEATKFKRRSWVFLMGGLLFISSAGYIGAFGSDFTDALSGDQYPRFTDTLYYENQQSQLVALQRMKPSENSIHVRRKLVLAQLFSGVRISKSWSIQKMNGEWNQCSIDSSDCDTVWISNDQLHYSRPNNE